MICDGHLRKSLLLEKYGLDAEIEVNVTDFDETEAKKATLTKDPLAAMAGTNADKLDEILRGIDTGNEALQKMLADLADDAGLYQTLEETEEAPTVVRQTLAERFCVPPFSILDARQGYWQERKRLWLAKGIKSELGRGGTPSTSARVGDDEPATYRTIGGRKANAIPGGGKLPLDRASGKACPGGSPRPAMKLENGKTVRGDGKGRKLGGE